MNIHPLALAGAAWFVIGLLGFVAWRCYVASEQSDYERSEAEHRERLMLDENDRLRAMLAQPARLEELYEAPAVDPERDL